MHIVEYNYAKNIQEVLILDKEITSTNYELDGITYIVESSASENATETLHKKVEKLLIRDLRYFRQNEDTTSD